MARIISHAKSLTPVLSGGTNLRVCLVTLQGDGKFEITQSKYRLSEEQKNGDGQALFDFCAESLKTFVLTNTGTDGEGVIKEGQELPLGFTVSVSVGGLRRGSLGKGANE